jgi:carboxylate-amine ligase
MASRLTLPRAAAAPLCRASFRFGIEEEYFLADGETLRPACRTPDSIFRRLGFAGVRMERELLQSQLEIATAPHADATAVRRQLMDLRVAAAQAVGEHGLRILACGTHPSANWLESVHSPKPRYGRVMEDLQMLGQRNMLCGMHVHVEFPDPSRRVEIMTRMLPYVPLLLALSTSSPFWQGRPTGLKGYRLAAYDELPRTGLPELFRSEEHYGAYLEAMKRSHAIEDASHVWWAIRPSEKYPTLELRAPDCCTRAADALAIAALYRVLIRLLYRAADVNDTLDVVDRAIAVENKWRAQRYGISRGFVGRDGAVVVSEVLEQIIEQAGPDIEALQCQAEIDHCRSIIVEGTSADAQIRIYAQNEEQGTETALYAVNTWIADATLA